MDVSGWNQFFSWAVIVFSLLTVAASGGALITRNMVAREQEAKLHKLSARNLSDDQKRQLKEAVANIKGIIGFASRLMDGEGADFAEILAGVFKDAGWEIVPTNHSLLIDLPGKLTLFATDPKLSKIGDTVAAALRQIGLDCEPETIQRNQIGGDLKPDALYVAIGRKL